MEDTATTELDGKRYETAANAVSGPASAPPLSTAGRNIDGFFRRRTITTSIKVPVTTPTDVVAVIPTLPSAPEFPEATSRAHSKRPTVVPNRTINHTRAHTPQGATSRTIHVSQPMSKTQTFNVRRGAANHARRHTLQRSTTLRRDIVPAPTPHTHNLLRPAGALQHGSPGLITFKPLVTAINSDRLARAQSASKSPLVARHAVPSRNVLPTFVPVAVQPAPNPMPGNGDGPTAPAPRPTNQPAPTDIFEHALTNATNYVDLRTHKTQYRRKARTHVASMTIGTLALLLIAGFVAYQNSPNVQLAVAGFKAGVSARMPDLSAVGLAYNGVRAGDGKLTLGLKGQAGDYQLTQANTNLSDSDMIQTIGATDASGTPTYQVIMAGSTVAYRFGTNTVTWVSNGKWYTLTGTNTISNQQAQSIVQHT